MLFDSISSLRHKSLTLNLIVCAKSEGLSYGLQACSSYLHVCEELAPEVTDCRPTRLPLMFAKSWSLRLQAAGLTQNARLRRLGASELSCGELAEGFVFASAWKSSSSTSRHSGCLLTSSPILHYRLSASPCLSCCRASSLSPVVIEVVLIATRCGLSLQQTSIAVRFAAPFRFIGYVASPFLSFSSHFLVFWVIFGYLGLFVMLFNPSLVRRRPYNHLVNLLRVVTTVSADQNRDLSPTGSQGLK